MARVTLEKSRPLLSVLESKLRRNQQSLKFTKKLIGNYGGIYLALKQEIKHGIKNQQFKELYLNFITSRALSRDISPIYNSSKPMTLNETIKELYDQSQIGNPQRIRTNLLSFLSYNSSSLLEEIYHPMFNGEREGVMDWVVKGDNFSVDLKKSEKQINQKQQEKQNLEDHVKGLTPHKLIQIQRNEIFGNRAELELIDNEIPCLLAYDSIEKRNPFLGFPSYLMFLGRPGTGKSLLARYAMTLGKQLADKYQKPLSLVQLDIKDSWKNGAYLNLEKQFATINQGDQTYIIFIDEIDRSLTEHNDSGAIEQFLKFRGGAEYQNKGNYMVIAGTNKPDVIHKGIMRVFQTFEVKGPETPEEKLNLLKHNLSNPYLNVSSWQGIYLALQEYNFSGGDIKKISDMAKLKQRRIARNISLQGSASQIDSRVNKIVKSGNSQFITYEKDVLDAISFKLNEKKHNEGVYA